MFKDCKGVIIDIRNNGGGSVANVNKLACRFTNEQKILKGYKLHKTGKGHNDRKPFEKRNNDNRNNKSSEKENVEAKKEQPKKEAKPVEAVAEEKANVEVEDLSTKTVAELRELAKAKDVKGCRKSCRKTSGSKSKTFKN